MTLSARARREKGAVAEREVLGLFRAAGWPHAHRTSTGGSQAGLSDLGAGPEGCAVEIKRQEALNVPAAFDQLRRDAEGRLPILVHRPSRHEWMATLPLADLLPLLYLREREVN